MRSGRPQCSQQVEVIYDISRILFVLTELRSRNASFAPEDVTYIACRDKCMHHLFKQNLNLPINFLGSSFSNGSLLQIGRSLLFEGDEMHLLQFCWSPH